MVDTVYQEDMALQGSNPSAEVNSSTQVFGDKSPSCSSIKPQQKPGAKVRNDFLPAGVLRGTSTEE